MEDLKNIDLLSIDQNWLQPGAGKILISKPFSGEAYFDKSVVYIAKHDEEGSVGFILNKPVLTDINIIKHIQNYSWNLWFGGPVQSEFIYFIHTAGKELVPGCLPIAEGIFWGGDFNLVTKLIEKGKISEKSIRFFLGYSGWEKGQLEKEINEKFWIVGKLDTSIIMDTEADTWKEAVKNLGGRYRVWENLPPDPLLN
ncbi:MAG: YqgE/AlgH family protein [Bacteroidales bacterium]|nr:YqgE/AlgH family protein [Bacteroidales bacterium]